MVYTGLMKSILSLVFAAVPSELFACQVCQPSVYARVFNGEFFAILGLLLIPLFVMLAIGWMVYSLPKKTGRNNA